MAELNNSLFIIAFIVLIFQFFIFYQKLGIKMITHPGIFFATIWLFSTFSQKLLMNLDLVFISDIESINEMNVFVITTSVFFSLWILIFKYESYDYKKNFNFHLNTEFYKKMLLIIVAGSFFQMLYTWYSIGVTSFNLALIRDLNTSDKTNYFGSQSDPILSFLKYTQFFYPVLTIFSGYYVGLKYIINEKIEFKSNYIFIPLLVSFIYVLTSGGRNPIFVGVKLYFIGLCFTIPQLLSDQKRRWILKIVSLLVISLTLFSTLVADSRSEYNEADSFSKNFDNPILSNMSGFIEYMGAHYYGYQLRNKDTFNENKLGLGYFTFNGLFTITMPFSNYIGLDKNLGDLLGFDENPIDYFYLWENDKEGYYTTNSVFLDLKLDFGFIGTIIFLILFTLYTHKLFLKTQNKSTIGVFTLFWFYLCFNFWSASNFKSFYGSGLVSSFIMFWLFSKFFIKKNIYFSLQQIKNSFRDSNNVSNLK
jgi:oligosaccharide repeat unit polymerase